MLEWARLQGMQEHLYASLERWKNCTMAYREKQLYGSSKDFLYHYDLRRFTFPSQNLLATSLVPSGKWRYLPNRICFDGALDPLLRCV